LKKEYSTYITNVKSDDGGGSGVGDDDYVNLNGSCSFFDVVLLC
jgi:hypothetical protein